MDVYGSELEEDLDPITLNPADEVERIFYDMVKLNRKKRADYALDSDPLSNFYQSSEAMASRMAGSFSALDSAEFNIVQKEIRLAALRANGRMDQTANESVEDTLIDRAVYSVLAVALWRRMVEAKARFTAGDQS